VPTRATFVLPAVSCAFEGEYDMRPIGCIATVGRTLHEDGMTGSRETNQGTSARRISRIQDMSMALAAFVILLSIFFMFTAAQAKGRKVKSAAIPLSEILFCDMQSDGLQ
jgi:hypothetical protein